MADYIDRDALLEKRWDVPFETEDARFVQVVDVQDIMDAPAADVAPVRHGRWILVDTDSEQFFICSECENKEYWESDYCPNCGARMDGGESNGRMDQREG